MFAIFIIITAIVVLSIIFSRVRKPFNTIELYVGTNGSGKSLNAVNTAIKRLRANTFKARVYNFLHPRKKKELPKLLSNLPIKLRGKIISDTVTADHVLLRAYIPEKSVVFIDDCSSFLSQMDYNNKNIDIVDDYCTYYRHYTHGGFMILTTQDINKVAYPFRYCVGEAISLSNFRKPWWGLGFIGCSDARIISTQGNLQSVITTDTTEDVKKLYTLILNRYDTYAYSDLYPCKNVPYNAKRHTFLKCSEKFKCPKERRG